MRNDFLCVNRYVCTKTHNVVRMFRIKKKQKV